MQLKNNLFTTKYIHQLLKYKKTIDPCERSVYQLLEQYVNNDKGGPKAYRATAKAHVNLFKKIFFANVFRRLGILH